MRVFLGIIFTVQFICHLLASASNLPLKKIEQINVKAVFSGDITGGYNFSGPLGTSIDGSPDLESSNCQVSSLFRKVKHQGKHSIEVWMKLNCLFKGQNYSYKLHRFYLELSRPQQKIKLPFLAENLKNIQLTFDQISLKMGKK